MKNSKALLILAWVIFVAFFYFFISVNYILGYVRGG